MILFIFGLLGGLLISAIVALSMAILKYRRGRPNFSKEEMSQEIAKFHRQYCSYPGEEDASSLTEVLPLHFR